MAREYWDEKFETMPHEEREKFQLAKLKETVAWVYERVPFYKKRLEEKGLQPADIRSLADLVHLPFTLKTDLRDNYPFGLCAVPLAEVARIHASSGTTGKPVTGPYTREDLEQWAECNARVMWAQGTRPEDICQNALGMGLFTGGLGIHHGIDRIGGAIVPTGGGMTERQIMLLQDFGTTVLYSTPSYGMTIVERAEQMGVDLKKLPLRICCFGGEPWTEEMRVEVEGRAGVKAYEMYGLTEMMGPGVGGTCQAHRLHLNEDHLYPEIIDPETEEPLPEGSRGELVLTALRRRAMPLLRFRTRDITALRREKCECGRTLITMDKVLGRSDDMLIISGVNVFPSQVESVLLEFKEMEPLYHLRVFKKGRLDGLAVEAEARAEVYAAGPDKVAALEKELSHRLHQVLGIKVPVSLAEPGGIPRSQGKAMRVIDQRKKQG